MQNGSGNSVKDPAPTVLLINSRSSRPSRTSNRNFTRLSPVSLILTGSLPSWAPPALLLSGSSSAIRELFAQPRPTHSTLRVSPLRCFSPQRSIDCEDAHRPEDPRLSPESRDARSPRYPEHHAVPGGHRLRR